MAEVAYPSAPTSRAPIGYGLSGSPSDNLQLAPTLHFRKILSKLNTLVKQWVRDMSVSKNMLESLVEKLGRKIYTFESYRLGVHHKGRILMRCAWRRVTSKRQNYFGSFFEMLKKQPKMTECRTVQEAFVPVVKMIFDGIEIDLLFARLALKEIPDNFDLRDDMLLKYLESNSVCRVTDEILRLVPNIDNFRLALRSIKLWAKNHGIYSNSLGYLEVVSWDTLVARTFQLYPNVVAATLGHKFFWCFRAGSGPAGVDEAAGHRESGLSSVGSAGERAGLVPPDADHHAGLSAAKLDFNVSSSTRKVRLNEFNADDHFEWCGLVEFKICYLIQNLERILHINLVHVNPKCFEQQEQNQKDDGGDYHPYQ